MTTSIALAAAAVLLWACGCDRAAAAADVQLPAADGLSLSEMTRFVEPLGRLLPTAVDWLDAADLTPDEGRGKKNKGKPLKMAMMMAGTAAGSMMMMKAMGAIKLFIIHSFFATKLGLIVAAYLLLCKMAEMKKAPAKQTVKWVSPPPSHGFDEHPAPSYEPAEQPPAEQYGPPQQQHQQQQPSDQYGPPPPPSQQQFMPSGGDFGGGDMQAHYSHVSPVTYRPMVHREQPDKSSSAGRMR